MRIHKLIGFLACLVLVAAACSNNAAADTTTTTVVDREAELLAIYEQHPSTHCWSRIFDYVNVLDSAGVGDLALMIGTEDPEFNIALQYYGSFQSRAYQIGADPALIEMGEALGDYCDATYGSPADAVKAAGIGNPSPPTTAAVIAAASEPEPIYEAEPTFEAAGSDTTPTASESERQLPQPVLYDGTDGFPCEFIDIAQPSADEVAHCAFVFWIADDTAIPDWVATPNAVDQLFEVSWEPPFGTIECRTEESAWGTLVCDVFFGADESAQMYIDGNDSVGYQIQAVGFYGNPPGWQPVD